jgi:EpsI family protein
MIVVLVCATAGTHFASRTEKIPLVRPLSTFPSTVNGLQGHDVALEAWQIQALEVTDHLSRVYSGTAITPIALYIGYYNSQRSGQVVHTPKNCLPGSGWEPITATRIALDLADGRHVPVNFYILEKGLDRVAVVYWYQAHGRIVANEYLGKFYTMLDAVRLNRTDASVVRISSPISRTDEQGTKGRVLVFAQQSIPQVERVISQ